MLNITNEALLKLAQCYLILSMMPDKNLICVPSTITYRNIEIPDDLQACHDMNRKNQVIIKFKCRKEKYCVLSNCKTIQKKKKKKKSILLN